MRGSKPLTLSDMRFVEGSLRWLSRFRHGECWTNRGVARCTKLIEKRARRGVKGDEFHADRHCFGHMPAGAAEPSCPFCAANRRSCQSCGRRVCPKHVCTANGCCLGCLAANQEHALEGRCTTEEEDAQLAAAGGSEAGVYGEMTVVGFRSLAKRIALCADDVYLDVGSGLGRTVFQAAQEFGVMRSVGVELAGSRHELAEAALLQQPPDVAARVILVHGDCCAAELWEQPAPAEGGAQHDGQSGSGGRADASAPCASATAVFAASLFFGDALMARLKERVAGCRTCRVVATLQRWEEAPAGFVEEDEAEVCETTWTAPTVGGAATGDGSAAAADAGETPAGCPVHLYVRR